MSLAVRLQPGESVGFWLLARLFLVLGFGMAMGGTGGESLFVRAVGVERLPGFFVATDMGIAAGSLMLALAGERVRPVGPFLLLLPCGAAGVILLAPLVARGSSTAVFAAYWAFQVSTILMLVHLSRYIGLYLDIGQAKRQLPALYVMSALGLVVGGLAVPAVVGLVGNVGLLVVWALGCLGQLLLVREFDARVKPLPGATGGREQAGALGPLVTRYPLFWQVLLFTGVATVVFRVMDVHANRLIAAAYPGAEELAAFYGAFGAAGSLGGVLLGTFATPWLLGRLGIALALAAVPAVACGAAGGLALLPGLGAAIAGRACVQVLRASVMNPTLDIIQRALPARLVSAAILVTSGIVIPGATMVVYALLAALGDRPSDARLGTLAGAGAVGLVLLVPLLARSYARVLLRVLESRQLSKLKLETYAPIEMPAADVAVLLGHLRGSDPMAAELAAELLAMSGDAKLVEPLRDALETCTAPRVARALLRYPALIREPGEGAQLLVTFSSANAEGRTPSGVAEARVRTLAVILENLAERDRDWLPVLEPYVEHADAGVRASALIGIGRHRELSAQQRAALVSTIEGAVPGRPRAAHLPGFADSQSAVNAMSATTGSLDDQGQVRAALRVCATLGVTEAIPGSLRLLTFRQLAGPAIEALAVLDRQPDAARLAAYERALTSVGPGGREAACTLLSRGERARALQVFVRLLGRNQPSVVERAKAFLSLDFENALPAVLEHVRDARSSYACRREGVALLAHWRQDALLGELAMRWTAAGFAAVDRLVKLGALTHADGAATGDTVTPVPERDFLAAVLAQRAREGFALAGETHLHAYHPAGRATVMDGLRSNDRGLRARALEALGAALPADARRTLTRAFEDVDPADLAAHGRAVGMLPALEASPVATLEGMARDADAYVAAGAVLVLEKLGWPGPVEAPAFGQKVTGGNMKTLDRLMFLKSVAVFRDFPVEDLSLIADVAHEVPLAADAQLFREGEPADRLWLLVSGLVTLYTDKGGHFHLLTMLAERDAVGEVALFDAGVHPASGRVEEAGLALVLEREDLLALVRDYPSLAVAFLTHLAQTVRRFQGRMSLTEAAMVEMGREAGDAGR